MINILDTNDYGENKTAIDIIMRERLDSTEIVACSHSTTQVFDVHIPLPEDGRYNVYHMILPNVKWLEEQKSVNAYKKVYVADGKSVFEFNDGNLCQIDPLILTANLPQKTTVIKYQKELINLQSLWKCFIDKCEEYLKRTHSSKDNTNDKTYDYYLKKRIKKCESQEIEDYAIDFLFITLNLLQCLDNSDEAEELIERLEGCRGFCPETTLTNNNNCNCKK